MLACRRPSSYSEFAMRMSESASSSLGRLSAPPGEMRLCCHCTCSSESCGGRRVGWIWACASKGTQGIAAVRQELRCQESCPYHGENACPMWPRQIWSCLIGEQLQCNRMLHCLQ